jgi:hypothetical protein
MKSDPKPVLGVIAHPARPTLTGAFWLATCVSVPVFCILAVAELVWRLWPF